MVDDGDGDGSPSPEPRTDSRSALLREFRAWRRLRIIKHNESFSLGFFLPEREYMEFELRSWSSRGARGRGRAQGVGHAPAEGTNPKVVNGQRIKHYISGTPINVETNIINTITPEEYIRDTFQNVSDSKKE